MLKSKATKHQWSEQAYFRRAFDLTKPGLRAYFGNVVKGQPKDYQVVTFAKGTPTIALLQQWNATLKSIHDKWPTLYEYEIDLAKKVGPMSIMLPLEQRLSDIDSYYEGISLPSTALSDQSIRAVISEWSGLNGLRIRSQAQTLSNMKLSTNSGSPYFTKRRNLENRILPSYVTPLDKGVVQDFHWETWMAAAVLGWRGQEGGESIEDVKQRVVWMFPFAVNLCELQVYQPLIEGAQQLDLVPAWVGMDDVDRRITAMFDTKASDDLVVCTDFSKFDQHFNPDLQRAAFRVLERLLQPGESSKIWLDQVFPVKYMIPLAYNWESVRFGNHGMGSGSGGTNADETIAHRALQYEAALSHGARLNPNSQCLGDDGVLTYPGITVDDVVRSYVSHGLEMNPEKQYASRNDCTYLRRWHHQDYRLDGVCVGVYSTMRALGRMRYLERRPDPSIWSDEAICLRELSILENCKYHPLFEQFVDFCIKRDRLRLGLAVPGFLDNIERIAQELIDQMPDFLGYTRSQQIDPVGGIKTWRVYRYLKSKS